MEKAYSLDPKEAQAYAQLEEENSKALAQYGALSLDMEATKKRLEAIQEQQRSFVRSALMHRDVASFVQARCGNGNLYCTLPDPQIDPAPAPAHEVRPNGKGPRAELVAKPE